jgi:hypothetical protein
MSLDLIPVLIRNPWFDKLTMTTKGNWIPAFAGMTKESRDDKL